MISAVLAGVLVGVALGTISGCIPGIHVNTMAGLLLSGVGVLTLWMGPVTLAVALFAALITHTFLDIVPGTFFGIPDPDTALSVLPAHALCLKGDGPFAVRISALGSAWAVLFSLPFFLVFFFLLPFLQPALDWGIGIVLLAIVGYMVISSESPGWALLIVLVSGVLGLVSMRYSFLCWHVGGGSTVLMPLLGGMFGLSVLLTSSEGTMPEQRDAGRTIPVACLLKNSMLGTCAGAFVGWLPGLSNATANALLSGMTHDDEHGTGFLVATSAANTANAFLSLAAFYALSRMRNGVMVYLSAIPLPDPFILLIGGVIAAVIAFLLTVGIAGWGRILGGISVKKLSYAVTGLFVALTLLLCGPFGLFILLLATGVGLVPYLVNVRRVFCMGAIIVPVICISLFSLSL